MADDSKDEGSDAQEADSSVDEESEANQGEEAGAESTSESADAPVEVDEDALSLSEEEIAACFDEARVPERDRSHPAAPILLKGWAMFRLGDNERAREILEPLATGEVEAPASYKSAADTLTSMTRLETGSLIFGAAMVVFFITILALLY